MAGKKAGELRKDGRPAERPGALPHMPTPELREKVAYLAGIGVPHEHIAVLIGLSDDKTMRSYYTQELKSGKAKANARVGQLLFNHVEKGNLSATIFWLKAQAGWRETQTVEHTGPGGGPIQHEMLVGATDRFFQALFGSSGRRAPVVLDQAKGPALIEGDQ